LLCVWSLIFDLGVPFMVATRSDETALLEISLKILPSVYTSHWFSHAKCDDSYVILCSFVKIVQSFHV
jgi:hypothetical protein